MTDRELLELAAKAAGLWDYKNDCIDVPWSARNDDGDCARLESALGIHVTWHSDGVVCGKRIWQAIEMFDAHGGDKQAARRMASLRVAAEIGKAMP